MWRARYAHATVVADPAVGIHGVRVRGAVLGDHDLARRVLAVEREQDVAQAVGRDLPAHLRLLRAGSGRRSSQSNGSIRQGADADRGGSSSGPGSRGRPPAGRLSSTPSRWPAAPCASRPSLRIAATEQRIEEPGVASGAPLRGGAPVARPCRSRARPGSCRRRCRSARPSTRERMAATAAAWAWSWLSATRSAVGQSRRPGAWMPSAWPRKAKTAGSLKVIQSETRSPSRDATSAA